MHKKAIKLGKKIVKNLRLKDIGLIVITICSFSISQLGLVKMYKYIDFTVVPSVSQTNLEQRTAICRSSPF